MIGSRFTGRGAPLPTGPMSAQAFLKLSNRGFEPPGPMTLLEASKGAPMAMPPMEADGPITDMPDVSSMVAGVNPRKTSFLHNLGDYFKRPDVAAALFRSGAATLKGGLGAGLEAGAGYMDDRRASDAKSAQQQFQNGLALRGQNLAELTEKQRNDLALMGIDLDTARVGETARHNRAGEMIDANGQRVQKYGIDTSAKVAARGQDIGRANNTDDNAERHYATDVGAATSRYNTDGDVYKTVIGNGAGIGSKNGAYTETKVTEPGKPASNGFLGWGGTPASPKTTVTTRAPVVVPLAVPAPGAGAAMPTPQPGQVVGGRTFLGGDPRNPASWR